MDNITNLALEAVRLEDPNEARLRLEALIEQAPDRLDLRHSLVPLRWYEWEKLRLLESLQKRCDCDGV